ncbi:Major facilitator superfamily protein [Abeliophyllum distichum]|uniref:Major facilitator superfamily protein n=1 Tax=Abeliophyllum distichum TaxID=126358 RepID=A0ABD1TK46_9LAMI
MEKQFGLSHLLVTVFLYCFANFMVIPAKPDVTMAALCPGKDKCSLAIYLTGAQQAIIGLGSLVVMPLIGNLSDTYGRKVMLTVPHDFWDTSFSKEEVEEYEAYLLPMLTSIFHKI